MIWSNGGGEGGRAPQLSAKEGPSEEDILRSKHRKLFSFKDLRANPTRDVQRP